MNNLTDSQELEQRVAADGVAINQLFTRVAALEERFTRMDFALANMLDDCEKRITVLDAALAKQRALNEELFAWFESDCDSEVSESLVAAFVEVLK